MALVTWQPKYSVNVKEIDKQHQQLINIINDLHDGMKAGKGKEVLSGSLTELIRYTSFHFNYEEKLFDKYLYPRSKEHKDEHVKLIFQVQEYKDHFDSGRKVLSMEVMDFLKEWLTSHIAGSDKGYSSFLNGKGIV